MKTTIPLFLIFLFYFTNGIASFTHYTSNVEEELTKRFSFPDSISRETIYAKYVRPGWFRFNLETKLNRDEYLLRSKYIKTTSYHKSPEEAERGVNPITKDFYGDGFQVIYAREIDVSGNLTINSVQLIVPEFCFLQSEACDNNSGILLQPIDCFTSDPLPGDGSYNVVQLVDNEEIPVTDAIKIIEEDAYFIPPKGGGNFLIYYTFNMGGDSLTWFAPFDVQSLNPQVFISDDFICGNLDSLRVRVNPSGGNLTGSGIIDSLLVGTNQFYFIKPSILEVGNTYDYQYVYSQVQASGLHCADTTIVSFEILPYPEISLNNAPDVICEKSTLTLTSEFTANHSQTIFWFDPEGKLIQKSESSDVSIPEVTLSGQYRVTIVQENGCEATDSVQINLIELPALQCNIESIVSCFGANDAVATVNILNSEDTEDYTFVWSNDSMGQTVNLIAAGFYGVTVTNDRGCIDSCQVEVSSPEELIIDCTSELQHLNCEQDDNGFNQILVSGGVAPYSFSLNGSDFSEVSYFENLIPGIYTVDVKDANDCIKSCTFEVLSPEEFQCEILSNPISCHNGYDGMATVILHGGVAPYSYVWNTGDTTSSITGIGFGTYTVTVTDFTGCSTICSINLRNPPQFEANDLDIAECITSQLLPSGYNLFNPVLLDLIDPNGLGNGFPSGNQVESFHRIMEDALTGSNEVDSIIGIVDYVELYARLVSPDQCMAVGHIKLQFNIQPHITKQPSHLITNVGDSNVCVSVVVEKEDFQYQWQKSNGDTFENIDGARESVYCIPHVTETMQGSMFRVIIYDERGLDQGCYTISQTAFLILDRNKDLACLDAVNISLNTDGEVYITPGMILSTKFFIPGLIVNLTDHLGNPVPNPVTCAYAGQQIKAMVVDTLLGRSCWGTVLIEDKSPPFFECPADTIVSCYYSDDLTLPDAFDNCDSTSYVEIVSDEIVNADCHNEWSAIRKVVYQAIDKWGNKSDTCMQQVFYRRLSVEDIVFPPHYDGISPNRPHLACDENIEWDLNDNYYPDPWIDLNKNGKLDSGEIETDVPRTQEGYAIIPNKSYCEIVTTYKDLVVELCENSYKVIREWKLLDWCTNSIRTEIQIIKVLDDSPPVINCPEVQIIEIDPWNCMANYKVEPPEIDFDCSGTNYTVEYIPGNQTDTKPGDDAAWVTDNVEEVLNASGNFDHFIIKKLQLGRTWIRYTVTDACGNFSTCITKIDVMDKSEPTAVCLENTNVHLGELGFAKVYAADLDNGSYDQCSGVSFQVRRKGSSFPEPKCEGKDPNGWLDFVVVCCTDAGKIIQVELRVWDDADEDGIFGSEGDFYSTCWVNINVTEKTVPILVIPSDTVLHCTDDPNDLDLTGRAISFGVCGPLDVHFEQQDSIISCNNRIIFRHWKVYHGENTVTGTQRITITNLYPFDGEKEIEWPLDSTFVGCVERDSDPEHLNNGYNFPVYEANECTTIASSYEDQILSSVEGVCYKILRTWTVIDWCKYETSQRTGGIWSHVQIIKVNDTEAPQINQVADITECLTSEDCSGFIELVNSAEDCTPHSDQKWSYTIDLFNDGSVPAISDTGHVASGIYPVGTHLITWKVKDQCGNKSEVSHLFTIKDCKKPTLYCISELTTVVMPSSGTIEIWAVDFDLGSQDNCTEDVYYTFDGMYPVVSLIGQEHYFKGNGLQATESEYTSQQAQKWIPASRSSSYLLGCDNIGINNYQMWVWDGEQNGDFCHLSLNLQSNQVCQQGNVARVGGRVTTADDFGVTGTEVELKEKNGDWSETYLTDHSGKFTFNELTQGNEYELRAKMVGNPRDGISTYDLLLIQRHILGIQTLEDPYQLIAADVNNSKSVTATDILQLRRLILGIYDEFPQNSSWKCIDGREKIKDPGQIWGYREFINLRDIEGETNDLDFLAIKIGDVDRSYQMGQRSNNSAYRSEESSTFEISNQSFDKGENIEIKMRPGQKDAIIGFQTTLDFNSSDLEYTGFKEGSLKISGSHINENNAGIGQLAISWNDDAGIDYNQNEELFTLQFRTKTKGDLKSNIYFSDKVARSELYTDNLKVKKLKLEISELEQDIGTSIELFQNRPNPFTSETVIRFVLPTESEANLSIFETSGRLVHRVHGVYPAGQTDIRIDARDIPVTGTLYYILESNGQRMVKKMVKL